MNLGCSLSQLDRCEEAVVHLRMAVELDPELAEAHNQFGVTLTRLGRYDDAIAQFREALRIRPDHPATLRTSATHCGPAAIWTKRFGVWKRRCGSRPTIRAGASRPKRSARSRPPMPICGVSPTRATARTAIDLAKQWNNPSLTAKLRSDLALYEAGKPTGPIPEKR